MLLWPVLVDGIVSSRLGCNAILGGGGGGGGGGGDEVISSINIGFSRVGAFNLHRPVDVMYVFAGGGVGLMWLWSLELGESGGGRGPI